MLFDIPTRRMLAQPLTGGAASPESTRRPETTTTPRSIRQQLPDPKWTIARFLEHKGLPSHTDDHDRTPALSTQAPDEKEHNIPRIPVPIRRQFLVDLRKQVGHAGLHGYLSIVSPFGGYSRFPLWTAAYWIEVDIILTKRKKYEEAQQWLSENSDVIPGNLVARVHADWQQFPWGTLNEHLKSAKTGMLPEPDDLLQLFSRDWLEDPVVSYRHRGVVLLLDSQKLVDQTSFEYYRWTP